MAHNYLTNGTRACLPASTYKIPVPKVVYTNRKTINYQPMMNPTDFLDQTLSIEIDRPLGSAHPTHGFIYPLNYGYVPGVIAPDGEELDAYLLGVFEPVHHFTGKCIAVIHRLDDDDDKLIIVPQHKQYTDEQIRALTEFQEQFFTSVIYKSNNKHT